jgi:predicted DNA-binding WGR domain protein
MKLYLENRGNTNGVENNKFYELETKNNKLYCRWGSTNRYNKLKNKYILCPGIKIFTSNVNQKYTELLNKKQRKGYVIIQQNRTQIENRPSATGRKFGVEIETNTNLSKIELSRLLKARNLKVRTTNSYIQSNGDKWDIKNDSSCGYEIASPILSGAQGVFDLKLAADKIKDALNDSHMPDSDCGIHITVDISDFTSTDIKRLIIGFLKAQHHFYKMCNTNRQNNTYCKKYDISKLNNCIRARTVSEIKRILGCSKYKGLNLSKLDKKVVEFRMFQSELGARKITNWVRTCVGFVEGIKCSNITFTTNSKFTTTSFNNLIKDI